MQLEQKANRWTDAAISIIRNDYLAEVDGHKTLDKLKEECGLHISLGALSSALTRYCPEERRAKTEARKKEFEARRARARELIASGLTVASVAEVMQVPEYLIYDWVPTNERPGTQSHPFRGIHDWLSRFTPSVVPDDPIVETGKLITELAAEDCRWPIGKDADGQFRFCGCGFHRTAATAKARPYCEAHIVLDVKPPAEPQSNKPFKAPGEHSPYKDPLRFARASMAKTAWGKDRWAGNDELLAA